MCMHFLCGMRLALQKRGQVGFSLSGLALQLTTRSLWGILLRMSRITRFRSISATSSHQCAAPR